MKIINEHTSLYRIIKEFEIEMDSGEILNICKSIINSDEETDNDWEWTDRSKEKFDAMPEEEQERIIDFIEKIKL